MRLGGKSHIDVGVGSFDGRLGQNVAWRMYSEKKELGFVIPEPHQLYWMSEIQDLFVDHY
jgi:hypothetical protein